MGILHVREISTVKELTGERGHTCEGHMDGWMKVLEEANLLLLYCN